MPTITDTNRVYSTIYVKCDKVKRNCLQKTETIKGETGKKIKLEELSLFIAVDGAGAICTATVTAQAGEGEETTIAVFEGTKLQYEEQKKAVNFEAEAGESIVLRWYLTTSDTKIRTRIRYVSYTYSVETVEDPEEPEDPGDPEIIAYLVIPCASETDAENIKNKIKNTVPEIEIYVKKDRQVMG